MALIELRGVYYRYPSSRSWALRNINLEVGEERLLVIGATGSGKTTLLRVMAGLIPDVYGGELRGEVVRRASIGYVPQDFDAFILMPRVGDELIYVLENRGVPPGEIPGAVRAVAREMGIEGLLDREVSALSVGERQRLAIASVLLLRPDVLILDEPLAYLDPAAAHRLLELLGRLGLRAVVIAEHRVELLADFVDRAVVIHRGEVVVCGEPWRVFREASADVPIPPLLRLGARSAEEVLRVAGAGGRVVPGDRQRG